MKKILVALVALVMMLVSFTASAESMDIYACIELAQSAIASDSTEFTMEVSYNETGDVVVFVVTMHTVDWELMKTGKSLPEFQNVISSLLQTNIAMKDVVTACGLPQNVIGMLVTSDGAIVAVYYNNADVTPVY